TESRSLTISARNEDKYEQSANSFFVLRLSSFGFAARRPHPWLPLHSPRRIDRQLQTRLIRQECRRDSLGDERPDLHFLPYSSSWKQGRAVVESRQFRRDLHALRQHDN